MERAGRGVARKGGVKAGKVKADARRKIIAQLAVSADGSLARPDGGAEWLERPMPEHMYGMAEFMRSVDTIL